MERLTDITVYAGVGWGATFTYTKSNGHYHRDTYFRRNIAPTEEFEQQVYKRFSYFNWVMPPILPQGSVG